VVSATDIAKARRSILSSSHRDIGRTPSPCSRPTFCVARFDVEGVSRTPLPRSLSAAGFVSHSRRQLLANAAIVASRVGS